jgi:hypothetical protein
VRDQCEGARQVRRRSTDTGGRRELGRTGDAGRGEWAGGCCTNMAGVTVLLAAKMAPAPEADDVEGAKQEVSAGTAALIGD